MKTPELPWETQWALALFFSRFFFFFFPFSEQQMPAPFVYLKEKKKKLGKKGANKKEKAEI